MTFTESIINEIWNKATIVSGYDSNLWRKDVAGAWIGKEYYGRMGQFGWEIDHLKPIVRGGTDSSSNLYAMHWQNNRSKGDDYPTFKTTIKADGNRNVECIQSWLVS